MLIMGWALTSGGGNVVMPTLAWARDCSLQLLCTNIPPNKAGDDDESLPLPGCKDEEGNLKPLRKVPHVKELRSISILGTRQCIRTLEEDGEWLEALALPLPPI
eukprot:7541113-Ditylum_brightwellii.AAC.1